MRSALITGGAGFIGSHLTAQLLAEGWAVTVVDNFDPFYDPATKQRNLAPHRDNPQLRILRADIRDGAALRQAIERPPDVSPPDVILHFAAKAGVRESIRDPAGYLDVNIRGTQTLLDLAREWRVPQFVFASSSSVYGVNPRVPWSENDSALMPISPYGASKVSGELLGHVYSSLYDIRFIALRFFTVYGPRQRPDLAIHKFARLLQAGKPIQLFGDGSTSRDYTFIGDIIGGVRAAMDYQGSPYEVINLGSEQPISLREMLRVVAETMGVTPLVESLPEQPGDVPRTFADLRKAKQLLGYEPRVTFRDGVAEFWRWMKEEPQT